MKQNKNILDWILAGGLLLFFVFSFFAGHSAPEDSKIGAVKTVSLAGVTLNTEVADTEEARVQGLSYRPELGDENSMLFVFDSPGYYPFWMKDMNFPIDIIWIGENMRVVHIKENASPSSYPLVFEPGKPAKYVLETTAGFSSRNDLEVGDKVKFDF